MDLDRVREEGDDSRMNLTLSVPLETAQKAKTLAAMNKKSLSAWFRDQVESEAKEATIASIAEIDPLTASAIGLGLPLEEHWEDSRWRTLAGKHLR